MKKLIICAICALAFTAMGVSFAMAADAPAGPIKMEKTKNPVTFDHANHAMDCKECHHKWDGAGAIVACSSAGCHDNFDKKDKSDHNYYKAMHGRGKTVTSCTSCHKAEGKKVDKARKKELTGCKKSKCHP